MFVCGRQVTGIQSKDPAGRTGLITLETPSAASAQEIPQLPGERAGHRGALFPAASTEASSERESRQSACLTHSVCVCVRLHPEQTKRRY